MAPFGKLNCLRARLEFIDISSDALRAELSHRKEVRDGVVQYVMGVCFHIHAHHNLIQFL